MATYNEVNSLITTNLAPNTNITADRHKDVEKALLDFAESQWLTGDIKEVDCTNAYIAANFDSNGIGINERAGWAICNGYNGLTKNRKGRTSIGYTDSYNINSDPDNYPTMGATGGFKDAAIIDHQHEYQDAYMAESNGYKPAGSILGSNGGADSDNGFYFRTRSGTGVTTLPAIGSRPLTDNPQFSTGSGLNKNMQPYIVTLFIQKL